MRTGVRWRQLPQLTFTETDVNVVAETPFESPEFQQEVTV
jgi:hypothetical protein